jgi:hypothetical protein
MKNNVKLTSVNILKDVYVGFKKNTIETDMNLQKLVNRCIDLYTKNSQFKETVDNHKTLGIKNSKY